MKYVISSSLRDLVAIAGLKRVDSREFEVIVRSYQLQKNTVRDLGALCRKTLKRYFPVLATMRCEGNLLPPKFEERLSE